MKAWFVVVLIGVIPFAVGANEDNERYPIPLMRSARLQRRSPTYTNTGFPVHNPPKVVVLSNGDVTLVPLVDRGSNLDSSVGQNGMGAPGTSANVPKNTQDSCALAVISCCSATTDGVNTCFQQLGCIGSFLGSSPCESEFAHAVIENAVNAFEI
uniref:Hydrophobin n=1 Tax=Photinus pyralis TaxID=7054 RepID=A0A1Y1N4P3_PHOPY